MATPSIAFVIPVRDRWELAHATIQGLLATTRPHPGLDFILIDNGSSSANQSAIAGVGPPFRVIRNAESRGFAAVLNQAIQLTSAELVVALSSDVILRPGWLEPMLAVMQMEPEAFAVGNVQTRADDGSVDHAGVIFHQEGYPIHFRASLEFIRNAAYREFPAVTAACLIMRRDRFLALGGFDESYLDGFEDIDLCLRARMRGWPTFVANRSWISHDIPALPGRETHEETNARRFLERWRPLTAVWQRDWENRLLYEKRGFARPVPSARPAASTEGAARLRVMTDLARLAPGGANGGIKVLIRESLRALHATAPGKFRFLLVVRPAVASEVLAWAHDADEVWVLPEYGDDGPPPPAGTHILTEADNSLARLLGADVLYCALGVSDFLTPDIPVIGVGVDLLHREHPECLPAEDVPVREAWFDRMLRTSFAVQCCSQWVAGLVQRHFRANASQLFVVHSALHHRLHARSPDRADRAPMFFYPANAWPHKNHHTLLVAYRLYRDTAGPAAWRLVLTGFDDPAMQRVLAHAHALGIGDHVDFRGFVTDEELEDLWATVGALAFPSMHEGFGIPLLEAMAHDVPIIAGPVGSIPEVAGDAYFSTDVRDPRALAAALAQLSSDASLRADLAMRGRQHAARFDFGREIEQLAGKLADAAAQFRRAGITWKWEAQTNRHAYRL